MEGVGGTVLHTGDQQYHLYVAEMRHGGLAGWSTYSECTHAVSTTIGGPYTRVGEVLVCSLTPH